MAPDISAPDRLKREHRKFSRIKRFSWRSYRSSDGRLVVDIEIDLADSFENDAGGAHFTFFNARDLKIGDEFTLPGMNHIIDIEDIASYGWEDIRYKVRDTETDCLSFYCQNFEAQFDEDS